MRIICLCLIFSFSVLFGSAQAPRQRTVAIVSHLEKTNSATVLRRATTIPENAPEGAAVFDGDTLTVHAGKAELIRADGREFTLQAPTSWPQPRDLETFNAEPLPPFMTRLARFFENVTTPEKHAGARGSGDPFNPSRIELISLEIIQRAPTQFRASFYWTESKSAPSHPDFLVLNEDQDMVTSQKVSDLGSILTNSSWRLNRSVVDFETGKMPAFIQLSDYKSQKSSALLRFPSVLSAQPGLPLANPAASHWTRALTYFGNGLSASAMDEFFSALKEEPASLSLWNALAFVVNDRAEAWNLPRIQFVADAFLQRSRPEKD